MAVMGDCAMAGICPKRDVIARLRSIAGFMGRGFSDAKLGQGAPHRQIAFSKMNKTVAER